MVSAQLACSASCDRSASPDPELVEENAVGVGDRLVVSDSLRDEVESLVGDQRNCDSAVDHRMVDARPVLICGFGVERLHAQRLPDTGPDPTVADMSEAAACKEVHEARRSRVIGEPRTDA